MPGFANGFAVAGFVQNVGFERSLVEAVEIDTARRRRNVNADRSRSELTCENPPVGRRTIGRMFWKAKAHLAGGLLLMVEAVGIDTARRRRNVNADRSRSELTCENPPVGRRTIGRMFWKAKAHLAGGLLLMVEAVGIEPTSEELRSPVSPCAAG